jgi:hypothetical protein
MDGREGLIFGFDFDGYLFLGDSRKVVSWNIIFLVIIVDTQLQDLNFSDNLIKIYNFSQEFYLITKIQKKILKL